MAAQNVKNFVNTRPKDFPGEVFFCCSFFSLFEKFFSYINNKLTIIGGKIG
jgi:hypothetical protein